MNDAYTIIALPVSEEKASIRIKNAHIRETRFDSQEDES